MMTIIAAVAADGGIGRKGQLLWHISDDLKHFKELTMGKPVVMGRNTWESLPKRPLPGRLNVVITSNPEYEAPGAEIARSLEEACRIAGKGDDYFIIGGGKIYKESIEMADCLELTEIEAETEDADTFFPAIKEEDWELVKSELRESSGFRYRFSTYHRRK